VLADRKLSAEEAKAHGLVNHIYPVETYLDEAIKLGQKVASMSQVAIHMAKDAVNKSYELNLQEGLNYEKRNFYLLFNTDDRVEGMNAFIEKRKPEWKNR